MRQKKKKPANTTRGDVLTPKISTLCCSSTLKVNNPPTPSSKSVPLQQRCRRRARCRSDAQELESHHHRQLLRRVSRLRPAPPRVAAQTRTDRGCGGSDRMGGIRTPLLAACMARSAFATTVREKLTPGHARTRERGGMA